MKKNIDYQHLLERALRAVVKDALTHAQFNGLGDNTHFYITFRTREPGVNIPDFLRLRYPEMMTIVLQYSFSNLN
ncbi:MAG: ClpXP protease specificity-enhancing factor SspB, partial [Alphaproteobacteria bacterium]|nr:ClpXP protease specificity-enhancing factor SspB [Alphaproteobacteria bacterium]